ncbi:putative reverse transcriptase domain-containing protein [Tanacetum coccineum]
MVGANHVAYIDRFHELAKLVPHLVTPESFSIKRYIHGLAPQIRGECTLWGRIRGHAMNVGVLTIFAMIAPNGNKQLDRQRKSMNSLEVSVGVTEEAEVSGIHVDPSKIEAVKNWKAPTTPSEKNQKYEWGKKEEEAFQILKNNLCDAPILSLLDGIEYFVVYCNASSQGLGCVLMQRGKVITYASRQQKIHKKNYTTHDLELGAFLFDLKTWRHYLYGMKSVIYTDYKSLQHIFNQKELNMGQRRWIELFSDYECEIRYHPGKANVVADTLSRKKRVKPRCVRAMVVTIQFGLKEMILAAQSEAFKQETVLAERLHGLDQQMERKEDRSLYFMDRIWIPLVGDVRMVILDEANKSKYFVHSGADKMYHDLRDMYWWPRMKRDIAIYVSKCLTCAKVKVELQRPSGLLQQPKDFSTEKWRALGTRLDLSIAYHPQMDGQSERTIQTLEDMLRASLVLWAEIGEGNLIGPEIVLEMTDKVVLIKEKLKAARDRQKSYADKRRKPLEFEVAYRLRLFEELSSVHDTFLVSNLKKCLVDANMHVPLEEIKVDKTLRFVKEPVEIMDREIKKLKRRKIALVKVR